MNITFTYKNESLTVLGAESFNEACWAAHAHTPFLLLPNNGDGEWVCTSIDRNIYTWVSDWRNAPFIYAFSCGDEFEFFKAANEAEAKKLAHRYFAHCEGEWVHDNSGFGGHSKGNHPIRNHFTLKTL